MEKNTKISPHKVPNGYFDNLSDRIMSGIKASESTTDLSEDSILLNGIDRKSPTYEVTEGYFSQLSDKIMSAVHSSNESEDYLNSTFGKPNVFSVENGYFESLAERIHHRIHTSDEDIEENTEFLTQASKQMPFTVPENYFETIQIPTADSTKKIDFQPVTQGEESKKSAIQKNFFKSMRWSSSIAASVVLLILGWGAFIMLSNTENSSNTLFSKSTANSVNLENTDENSRSIQYAMHELENVSNEDILEYLDENIESEDVFYIMDFYAKSGKKINSEYETSDDILNNVSKEALESYLENEGLL